MQKMIDFPTAIRMAVKSSATIIDKDFEEVMYNDSEDSSANDEESTKDMLVAQHTAAKTYEYT